MIVVAVHVLEWQLRASCKGHPLADDFYPPMQPERKHERRTRERRAKLVCATCPVNADCLQHALAVDERYGVWGGLTADERRAIPLTA